MQAILITDISDHLPIIHINWNFSERIQELSIVKRCYSAKKRAEFKEAIDKIDWTAISTMNDTQTAFSNLYDKLSNLQDKYFPKRRIQLKYNYKKPWLSEGLRQAIKTKNKLYRKSVIIKSS